MGSFFHMPRREAMVLAFLIVFSVIAFLPVWRTVEIAGMAAFGWFMVALMLVSPSLALWAFRERRP